MALDPNMVKRILPFQGSARCSRHNFVFLGGVRSALMSDVAFAEGFYETPPSKGIRAMARVYAGWGFSLVGFWGGISLPRDANNLLAMLSDATVAKTTR